MSSLRNGLGGEEIQISGLDISGTSAVYTHPYFIGSVTSEMGFSGANAAFTGSVVTDTINCDYISGTIIRVDGEGLLHSVSIGSNTAVYGAKIQAGSGTLSAGSAYWQVFPIAYTGKPSVLATNTKTASKVITVVTGSLSTGSAFIIGEAAADTFNWISVGI